MDRVSKEVRSRVMASVASADTGPEMKVRRLLHRLGYRYRVHVRTLAGTPDIVFNRRRKLVFVHGCFWHGHASVRCPNRLRRPTSNEHYWQAKLQTNARRDNRVIRGLKRDGWSVLVLWECQISDHMQVEVRLQKFLGAPRFPGGREIGPKSR